MKTSYQRNSIVIYLYLGLVSIVMFFPFYWMVVTALKTAQEAAVFPPTLFPKDLYFGNFITVINNSSILLYLRNSLLTTVIEAILVLVTSVSAAFGLFLLKGSSKKVLFLLCLILHALPFETIMVFIYRLIIQWSLNDTLIALILPFISNFMYVLFIYNAFLDIPQRIVVSSRLDGASSLTFLVRIALPYAFPTIVFIAIINGIGCWNSFLWPMMITNSPSTRTLPFGLYAYVTEIGSKNELVMAMSLLSQLPMIVLFGFLRKYLVYGYRMRTNRHFGGKK